MRAAQNEAPVKYDDGMAVHVRPYEPDDDGFWHVRSLTYNNGQPIPMENRPGKARNFVAEVDGEIQGVYVVLDITCTCRGAVLPCGGVAGVGVHPAMRGGGVGSAMMRHAIRNMRDQGIPMASLYAYREWYYRKFGYEGCGQRIELNAVTNRLPYPDSELRVRDYPSSEWPRVADCHEAFVTARNGGSTRTHKLWERVVSEKNRLYVAGEPAEAYALVQHEVDFWKTQPIQEMVWTTARGYRALLGLLANLGVNKTGVQWYEPGDSPMASTYMDHGITMTRIRPPMYRVTDVPAVLGAIETQETGSFTFEVQDDVIPENQGPWLVSYSPEGVLLAPASSADLSFTIQTFVQAMLGEPSLADLARNGLVEVRSAAALRAAETLLPPARVYCMEFF